MTGRVRTQSLRLGASGREFSWRYTEPIGGPGPSHPMAGPPTRQGGPAAIGSRDREYSYTHNWAHTGYE